MDILNLNNIKELIPQAAKWFHSKWGVLEEAYLESMENAKITQTGVPAWYVVLDKGEIVAGFGIIENDFHKRPDLTPNVCAVFVEEPYRGKGLARKMLTHACRELAEHGVKDAYLITTHTEFYEHCGWDFYGMIEEDEGDMVRMYHHSCP